MATKKSSLGFTPREDFLLSDRVIYGSSGIRYFASAGSSFTIRFPPNVFASSIVIA